MKITKVKINAIENPVGFQYEQLSCSWKVEDTKSKTQTRACIEISATKDFKEILYKKEGSNLRQSGEILELELKPRTTYFYRVTVVGNTGDQAISDIGSLETGKMNELWKGEWIGPVKEDQFHPILSKKFQAKEKVARARLYVTGVGLFEAYLNGEKIGEEYLTPYMNNYEQNIQVITFQLDEKIQVENTLEIKLAKGWYMGVFGLELQKENYGDRMAAIAEVYLEYEDQSQECIISDGTWTYRGSDTEDSSIYDGEICNRMLWLETENIEKPVEVLIEPQLDNRTKNLNKKNLTDRISLPIIIKEEITVKEIIHTPLGETVLDMGQNFAGFLECKMDLPKGTKVVFDFGEILQEGNFYNKNYRDAKSQFVYISSGGKETVSPHFTYFGFRYVRISGCIGNVKKTDYLGKVLYSDVERTGWIETSDAKINQLYENTVWGLKSNFMDIPTDCPQRSERLGWTGDAQVFAPTACYHMDTRAFFHKFMKDLQAEQKILNGGVPNYLPNLGHKDDMASVWGDIATLLPNTLFNFYGNLEEMDCFYSLMKDWVDYTDRKDEERGRQYLFNFGFTFGDWLALDGAKPTSFKGSTDDHYISSVYYYRSVQIVGEMSERLNKKAEAAYYKQLEEKIKRAVFEEFFTPSGRLAIDTQAAYVIALKFGICMNRERTIEDFKKRIKKDCNQIKCGFVGAPLLCTVLAEAGLFELAYDFLTKEEFPSWLYSVNLGATTIWERWNSVMPDGKISDTGMNSLNHYAYGSVMEFVYGYIVGIRPMEAGFKKAIIAPHPDIRIRTVDGRYDSVNGTYICNWRLEEDGRVNVHVEVPFNCTAELELPECEQEKMLLEAGSYDFAYVPKKDFRKPYSEETTLGRLAKDGKAMQILGKYTPALAGIAASGDEEIGANTLQQLLGMGYLPFDPNQLKLAITEIKELKN